MFLFIFGKIMKQHVKNKPLMRIILSLIFSLFLINAQAQIKDNINLSKSNYSFGVLSGTSQGLGMSVRYWPKNVGIQVSFLPYYTEYTSFLSMSMSGLFMLKKYETTDFYLTTGVHRLITDYSSQTIIGFEPSIGLNSNDGIFTLFGSFGYDLAIRQDNYYVYPGVACGFLAEGVGRQFLVRAHGW